MTTNDPIAENDSGSTNTQTGERVRVPVSGGTLVFERRELGKELVGFADVRDRDDLADALRARGLDHGALRNLPVLDE